MPDFTPNDEADLWTQDAWSEPEKIENTETEQTALAEPSAEVFASQEPAEASADGA